MVTVRDPVGSTYLSYLVALVHSTRSLRWATSNIGRYLEAVADLDRTDGNPDTFLAVPAQRDVYHASFTEGFAQGSKGIVSMCEALIDDWGFDFTKDVLTHFDIFYKDLDASLKPALGQAMADAMPDATFHLWKEKTGGREH